MLSKTFKPLLMLAALLFSGLALADAANVPEQAGNQAEVVWQALQQGAEGRTTSTAPFAKQAINSYDPALLEVRNNYLSYGIFAAFFGMIGAFIVFIAVNGISKLSDGFSGKLVYRWSKFDLFIHWLGAIPCLLLIITGLTLLAGKFLIEPFLGQAVFAQMGALAKPIHDYMAIPFMLGWLLMSVKWAKNQMPEKADIGWMLVVGGYINFGPFKGKHPHAGFANAGEKMWFWTFALGGAVISATGVILLFPDLVEPSRTLSLISLVIHGITAIVLTAFAVIHIFMATVMSEGGMECMVSGYCDENWAIQHHDLWYDEIKANGTLKYKGE
ncbi:formate dehydrogenase subunit gamma [Ferrimonas lipolytica]|uniref:Formate dehydrogenase subunit gamma n=1 Tax=Ferrimonas lipolytica TaxID=2724191 RepID=A0A6H1UGS0_9GAMM|nr:formate dehydrogenase subunit gamma [Ferrimonas lipolytica]QIZ78305.1 formate dehydrogenase subunit gamma [Ferrimonas lipolytica]